MTGQGATSKEAVYGLRLALRGFGLAGVAALLWHAPVGRDWIVWLVRLPALVLGVVAFTLFVVAATGWRNLICRSVGLTNANTATIRAVGLLVLAGLLAAAAGLIALIGRWLDV